MQGSLRIFQLFGISVYVHWSWLLVAYFAFQFRSNDYTSFVWNIVEYLSLFAIVLIHEFGHSLACRQVGGQADQILLWPLGGAAIVNPPPRPGAWLWSIAAGPLVNVVLIPITFGVYFGASALQLFDGNPDLVNYLSALVGINLFLLAFNMLPIYPLDGGQVLHAILWFVIGRANSLRVACVIGILGSLGFVVWAILESSIWIGVIAAFAAYRCYVGFQQANFFARLEKAPRHPDAECPSCETHPLEGPFWQCEECGVRFDMFANQGECPNCGEHYETTACPECGKSHPVWAWFSHTPRPRYRPRDDERGPPDTSFSR